jgi:glycosyltransferase involved in cell wall biosynthesis
MSTMPLVSIIIPAYNQGKFIAETIDSVCVQKYPRREILVIDDGSMDDTPQVLRTYGDRLTAVRHDNIGENPTVNRGLDMARGDVVCVVNADDPLLPGAIEAAVACLMSDPLALAAYPDWAEIDPMGNVTRTLLLPKYDLRSMLFGFNVAVGPGVFIRRAALETVGKRNPRLRYTGDLDYWFRVAMRGGLRHIPSVLATHRVHPEAASSAARGKRMAAEVVRLIDTAMSSPDLPAELRPYRAHLFGTAHAVATHYCGTDPASRRRHAMLARLYRGRARLRAKLTGLPGPESYAPPQVVELAQPIHYHQMFA